MVSQPDFGVKTPIPLLIGIVISVWHVVRQRFEDFGHVSLMVPIVVIVVVFSFFNQINVGLRYILVVFPFLFVWLGQLVELSTKKSISQGIAGILV